MYVFIWLFSMLVQMYYAQPPSNPNQLKKQFHSSLHHMNEFLEDVEQKVKREREILEQFHYEDSIGPTSFMDYDVTDIWWSTMPRTSATEPVGTPNNTIPPGFIGIPSPTQNDTATTSEYPVGPDGSPLPEFPTGVEDFPERSDSERQRKLGITGRQGPASQPAPPGREWLPVTQTTAHWAHKFHISPETTPSPTKAGNLIYGEMPIIPRTTTLSPFHQLLEQQMEQERAGYLTMFVMKLLELVAKKPREHVVAVLRHVEPIVQDLSDRRVLLSLREPLYSTVMSTSRIIAGMPGDVIKSEATMFYSMMKNRNTVMAADMRAVFEYADTVFTDEQGERMFRALEDLDHYPAPGKSAAKVCKEVVDSVMEPYFRMSGSAKRLRLVDSLNHALQSRLAEPPRPARRSLAGKLIDYEKLIRRILHAKKDTGRGGRRPHTRTHHDKQIDRNNKQYSKTNRQHMRHSQKRFNVINRKNNDMDDELIFRNDQYNTSGRAAESLPLRRIVPRADNSEEKRFLVDVYDAMYHGPGAGGGQLPAGGGPLPAGSRPLPAGGGPLPAGRRAGTDLDLSSATDYEAVLKGNIYRYFGYDPELEIGDASAVQ